jgi:hypothetical protein
MGQRLLVDVGSVLKDVVIDFYLLASLEIL